MNPLNLTQEQLNEILDEVQTVLNNVTKSEKAKATRLAKAEGEDGPSDESSAGGEASAGGPPEASSPPAEASSPAGGPSADASAPADPAAAAPGGDPADPAAGGPVDPAALQAEYAKLPLDELKMHAEAAMAALQAAMGGAAGGDPAAGAGAPPAPSMAEASGAGGPPPMAPAMKKEIKVEGNGGEVVAAKKSEKEIADLKKSLEDNQAVLTGVIDAFTKFVSKPMRKAETALNPRPPAEGVKLSKSEAVDKLKAKVRDQSLTKKDRELINGVFFGTVSHDDAAVAHLLK